MSFLEKVVTKLNGKPAQLKVTDKDGTVHDFKFKNNYRLKQAIKLVDGKGFEYEVVYKRKEWAKQLYRVFWVFYILVLIWAIAFYDSNDHLARFALTMVLIMYVVDFKETVITLDY